MRHTKTADQLLEDLWSLSAPANREGMARFGIDVSKALGVSMPNIRAVSKTVAKNHDLASRLWQTGIHEARILASLVDVPEKVTLAQMNDWANDFNSWDVCDQVCGNLFDRVSHAETTIRNWHMNDKEFVKRAAFALIAWRAVHLKKEPDETYINYLPLIEAASGDNRNFVKKAVNWALRQIGKRKATLHRPALALASKLTNSDHKSARWIGTDAVRELERPEIIARLFK